MPVTQRRDATPANSRNGRYTKTVTTEVGPVEVQVCRDRDATFDRKLIPKGERRLDGLSAQVTSLYAKGLTTGEIAGHLEEIHGTSVSKDTISRITDAIVADMEAWQARPLESIYAVVLVDAIKVRDTQVANPARSTWRSGPTWTANATCSVCGSAPQVVREPSGG